MTTNKLKLKPTFGQSALEMALGTLHAEVGSTMGPCGYNVSIMRQPGTAARITKDGATVAGLARHDDHDVEGFMKCIVEVAKSVETEVGDGTTTATVMSTTLLANLLDLTYAGYHPRRIIRDMDKIFEQLNTISASLAKETGDKDLIEVARVSTNHDEEMAKTVESIVKEIGPFGRFRTTVGLSDYDIVTSSNGYTIDTAVFNPVLLPNGGTSLKVDARIYILNKMVSMEDWVQFINTLNDEKVGGDVVVMIAGFEENDEAEILDSLVKTNSRGNGVYPVKLNGTPFIRNQQVQDIEGITANYCQVTLERRQTTFHFDKNVEGVEEYIESIKNSEETIKTGFDLELHKQRIQRLQGGFATIMAAGTTDTESKERRDRIDDAILATQSALREGYVLGGGNHYMEIFDKLEDVPEYLTDAIDNYLTAVFRTIHNNAGCNEFTIDLMISDVHDGKIRESLTFDDEIAVIDRSDYRVYDSAGTPVRVFNATKSLMHTLLPIKEHIKYRPSAVSF